MLAGTLRPQAYRILSACHWLALPELWLRLRADHAGMPELRADPARHRSAPVSDTAKMTDLEITRLCAEAMGCAWKQTQDGVFVDSFTEYDPLHDDAQAMAMVKKLNICVWGTESGWWRVVGNWRAMSGALQEPDAAGKDLNRAICECVAKMGEAK